MTADDSERFYSAEETEHKRQELLKDPKYRAAVETAETQRRERARLISESEAPIVADLHEAGFRVDSVWDLVNSPLPYEEALPVLLKHLERGGYHDRIMEGLGRALAVKASRRYWETIERLYKAFDGDRHAREGMALALRVCATADEVDSLIDMIESRTGGDLVAHFLPPVLAFGGERGRDFVESLRDDPEFGRGASKLLKRKRF